MADRNQLLPIPLPVKGLHSVEALTIPWESGYAREFTNYALYAGKVVTRPAVRQTVLNTSLAHSVHWFDISSGGSGWYAILANGDIRKLSDGSGASSIGGSPSHNATQVKHVSLNLVIGCREPRDAVNPFTAWSITTSVVTATSIRAACSHKGRLYVFDANQCEYSSIAQITGAMPSGFSFSFAEYLDGQSILRAFSVTTKAGDQSQNVMAIFADGGRVIVYEGDYPGSSNWRLIGKFDMPPPISNIGFVEISGDIWVSARGHAYWFRDLFQGGAQTAHSNSPTLPIENLWQGLFWNGIVTNPEVSHSFYEPRLDAIVTQCSELTSGPNNFATLADYGNEGFYLVYFRQYQAWAAWFTTPMFAPVQTLSANSNTAQSIGTTYNSELVALTYGNIRDQIAISGVTSEKDIEACWKTPYFRSDGKGHKVNGVRPFFENNVSGYFHNIRAIFNNSDFNATLGWRTQSSVTDIPPANYGDATNDAAAVASNQYTALMGAAGAGGSFSIQFVQKPKAGSSSTQAQALHAANAYIEPGSCLF